MSFFLDFLQIGARWLREAEFFPWVLSLSLLRQFFADLECGKGVQGEFVSFERRVKQFRAQPGLNPLFSLGCPDHFFDFRVTISSWSNSVGDRNAETTRTRWRFVLGKVAWLSSGNFPSSWREGALFPLLHLLNARCRPHRSEIFVIKEWYN